MHIKKTRNKLKLPGEFQSMISLLDSKRLLKPCWNLQQDMQGWWLMPFIG